MTEERLAFSTSVFYGSAPVYFSTGPNKYGERWSIYGAQVISPQPTVLQVYRGTYASLFQVAGASTLYSDFQDPPTSSAQQNRLFSVDLQSGERITCELFPTVGNNINITVILFGVVHRQLQRQVTDVRDVPQR